MDDLVSVEVATSLVLQTAEDQSFGHDWVSSIQSTGRILQEAVYADRDFPPFDRATMDGIAIQFAAYVSGVRKFEKGGFAPAGASQQILKNPIEAIEIMTGAMLPKGADTIIRYEDIHLVEDGFEIAELDIKKGQNVHFQGSDRKQGELLLGHGQIIGPAEIGVFATVGKTEVQVGSFIRTAIVATGDELVDLSKKPRSHQIRMSNVYTIAAILQSKTSEIKTFHLSDDVFQIRQKMQQILMDFDLVILSGGVSKGKRDYVPDVMNELGVEKIFHGVLQRPGKPFWFGRDSKAKTVIFALPGNPVSSFMCTHRYILPWIKKRYGLPPFNGQFAVLAEDFSFKPPLGYFLQVSVNWGVDGVLWAYPKEGKGSGDLANLLEADGFLELPSAKNEFKKGEVYPIILLR
jgi:molybdopterin molybdotransferase